MRSRASGVARLEAVPAIYACIRLFGALSGSMDVQRLTRGSAPHPATRGSVSLPIVLPEFELRRCSFGFLLTKAYTQPQEADSQVFTLQSFAQQPEETIGFQR